MVTGGNGNDLPVSRAQAEAELPCSVGVDLKFRVGNGAGGLGGVFQPGICADLLHAGDAPAASGLRFIDLGGGNGLAVGGFQGKAIAGGGLFDDEFAHAPYARPR